MPPIPIIRGRVASVCATIRGGQLDGLIVSSLPHVRYLSGFTGSNAFCFITARSRVFVTDRRYRDQSRNEVTGFRRIVAPGSLFERAAERGVLNGCTRVGFQSAHVTYAMYRSLRSLFPAVHFVPTSGLIEGLVRVKDAGELAHMQKAAEITDRVFLEVVRRIQPGVAEHEIAAEISYLHRRYGADRDAFDPLVSGGERAVFPHAKASSRRIKSGELVILDFGCIVNGYASDLTRTVFVGRPSRRAKSLYAAVLGAQEDALQAVKAGIAGKDLDAVARTRIQRAGYGRFFIHALGHGLGMQVHEAPRVSALSTDRLLAGDVITIEPGVYVPEYGGVRIEDDVVVLDHGSRVLTAAPKELIAL